MENLLEDISFNIPDVERNEITIDEEYVKEKFKDRFQADNIDKYIL
jgi:ATP-dependent HslUV protease ATP-binding subunit HslU